MEKFCKNCKIKQPITDFPAAYSKAGVKCYRNTCKQCKNEKAKGYYANTDYEVKKERYKKQNQRNLSFYFNNKEIREFNKYEVDLNSRWARYLNKKTYFKKYRFDYQEVVSETYLKMMEQGIPYTRHKFYLMMWGYMAAYRYADIKNNPFLWRAYLQNNRDKKARYRKNASNWYVNHLLSKKLPIEHIKANPVIAKEKKAEILNIRKNNNQPIENELPLLPPELIDLSMLDENYKGYAITMKGELYSCKALFKTDVKFTNMWRPIAKRKNGSEVVLSINGQKITFGTKKLLNTIIRLSLLTNS